MPDHLSDLVPPNAALSGGGDGVDPPYSRCEASPLPELVRWRAEVAGRGCVGLEDALGTVEDGVRGPGVRAEGVHLAQRTDSGT